jgi:molybdopterin biosynthesis enzyme MoaB
LTGQGWCRHGEVTVTEISHCTAYLARQVIGARSDEIVISLGGLEYAIMVMTGAIA